MTKPLPSHPDIDHLKNEAKALRKAHQARNAECCKPLRGIRRFKKLSDKDILASSLKLSEAQFAVAIQYGFKSWRDLKAATESTGEDDRYKYNIKVSKPLTNRTDKKELHQQFGVRVNLPKIVSEKRSLHDALGPFPVLETEHVRCREYRLGDEVEWHRLVKLDGTGHWHGMSPDKIREEFDGMRGRYYDLVYVIFWIIELKGTGQIIGDVRVWDWPAPKGRMADYASIAFDSVGPDARPEAVGEALSAIGEYLLSRIEIVRVQCLVYPEQTRKASCLKRTKFQEEGVLRAWWYDEHADQWKDELVFSMLPEDISKE
jgi:RimJ/RimL family protein N-acetyltransferase